MCEHKWMCKPYCLIKWINDHGTWIEKKGEWWEKLN